MKRVQINMDGILRGRVEKHANEQDMSMPQAYADLLRHGLDAIEEQKQAEAEAASKDGEITEA